MDIFPDLLPLRETAGLLEVSDSIVRRMINSRLIPLYRISGVVRFDRKDVVEYIEMHRGEGGEVDTYIAPHKSHRKKPQHKS